MCWPKEALQPRHGCRGIHTFTLSLSLLLSLHLFIIISISCSLFNLTFSLFSLFYFHFFLNIYPSLPFALSHHSVFVSSLLFPLPSLPLSLTPFPFLSVFYHLLYLSIFIFFLTPSHFTLPIFSISLSIKLPSTFMFFNIPLLSFSCQIFSHFFPQFSPSLYLFSSVTCVLGMGVLGLV